MEALLQQNGMMEGLRADEHGAGPSDATLARTIVSTLV
jgi:hypothetical protein